MQRALVVFVPLAAVAAAILVFTLVVRRERPDADSFKPGTESVNRAALTPEEAARILRKNEELEKENQKLKQALAASTVPAVDKSGAAVSESGESEKKPDAKKADWKKRKDEELAAKVKSMPWKKNVQGVLAYWKEIEAARDEGRTPEFSKELIEPLQLLQKDMIELQKMLETGSPEDVFKNEMVGSAWLDAFLQEVSGGNLTDGQLARLRETSLYSADPDPAANRLENWKAGIERNRAFGTEITGIMSPEQQALVSSTITPTYLMSISAGYGERAIPGSEAVAGVTTHWMKSFRLTDDQRSAVEGIASDFVLRQAGIAQAVSAQYGGMSARDAQYDLLVKSIEAQIAAEKKLSEALNLTPEQAQRFLKGSSAVLRIGQ